MKGDIEAKFETLKLKASDADASQIIGFALTEEFEGRTVVISSFGTESAVLLHLVVKVSSKTPVLFLNTGKLFGETLRYRDRLQDALGLEDVRTVFPNPQALHRLDRGGTLWSRDADACCQVRK